MEYKDFLSFLHAASDQISIHSQSVKNYKISYQDSKLNQSFINSYLLGNNKNVSDFLSLMDYINHQTNLLNALALYKSVEIEFNPGEKIDTTNILMKCKQKSRFFASLSHYFEPRSSEATLSVKLGMRNILGFAEKYTLEYDKALYSSKKSTFNFFLDFPWLYKMDLSGQIGYQFGQKQINPALYEHFDGHIMRIIYKKLNVSFENIIRNNEITNESCESAKNSIIPTRKLSLKGIYTLRNDLELKKKRIKGKKTEIGWENTLPGSHTQFFKIDFFHKNAIGLPNILKKIIPKHINKTINIENSIQTNFIVPLHSKNIIVNDRLTHQNLRGFREIGSKEIPWNDSNIDKGQHLGSLITFRMTNSVNFFNFPGLGKSNIIPFAFFSTIFTKDYIGNHFQLIKGIRNVAGFGLKTNIGGADLEILYNWWHYGQKHDKTTNFQLRLGLND